MSKYEIDFECDSWADAEPVANIWETEPEDIDMIFCQVYEKENAEYIVKACNAYPKLVEAVQLALTVVYRVENFGKPDEKYSTGKKQLMEAMNKGRAILTELKEL